MSFHLDQAPPIDDVRPANYRRASTAKGKEIADRLITSIDAEGLKAHQPIVITPDGLVNLIVRVVEEMEDF